MARDAGEAAVTECGRFRYGPAAQCAHWLTALLVTLIWALGLIDDAALSERMRELRALFHEIAGETVLALLFLRLALRLARPPPVERGWSGAASMLMRFALYSLLAAAPLTGIVALFAGGESLSVLGLFDLASPWPGNRELAHYAGEIHVSLANALLVVAAVHAIATLARHIFLQDGRIGKMLPVFLANYDRAARG